MLDLDPEMPFVPARERLGIGGQQEDAADPLDALPVGHVAVP
jgi:hypothetical protein